MTTHRITRRVPVPTSRAGRVLAALLSFALFAGAGAAVAAFLGRAEVKGSAKAGAFSVSWYGATVNQPGNSSECPTAAISSGALTLTPSSGGLFPGTVCTYTGPVYRQGNAADAYVTGLSAPTSGLLPGWQVKITSGCGQSVPAGGGTSGSLQVTLTLQIGQAASPGDSQTFDGMAVTALPGSPPASPNTTGCTLGSLV